MKAIVLEVIKTLINGYAKSRESVVRVPTQKFCELMPEPPTPFRLWDFEIAKQIPGELPAAITHACAELVKDGRLKEVQPCLYEWIEELDEKNPVVAVIRKLQKDKFVDWDVFNVLEKEARAVTIEQVNQYCVALISSGYLKLDGPQWYNTTNSGYCYRLIRKF